MDPTTLNTIVGIVGVIVSVIGIVVGIIGLYNVTTAIKIKNSIKANTVQQAQIIHNGLDDYAVIRISRETTQEELKKSIEMVLNIQKLNDENLNNRIDNAEEKLRNLKAEVEEIPRNAFHLEKKENGAYTLFIGEN